MATDQDKSLRDQLLNRLRGGGAHMAFDDFIADFPPELCGRKIDGLPYTTWQVIEHMRIAQWDILEFSRDASHKSPKFPEGYWPKPDELGKTELWYETIAKFREHLKQMEDLVAAPATDLFAINPHGRGKTTPRQALPSAE